MSRPRVLDHLQSHRFFVMDVKPSGAPPFLALLPIYGFQSVSGIGLSLGTETYTPLNSMYPLHFASEATVGEVTLTRGASLTDTDFYRWIERAIQGTDQWRRNLLVLHLTGVGATTDPLPFPLPVESLKAPGRAWMLWNCLPTGYQAGDLDATSGDVTLMSLTLQPQYITEVAFGAVI
ncbi:Bacteriophage T4, Gp19, tail tube [uncultured Caudovirales phage]|uniref:Bacteriophage T4, Gp19, tail tube n=1 Tax=uncultured Caudovirales phage TaxID=2100421 RepID=A0A6J5S5A0_9CAUD|nr:Bacteriophage T4, Gp19, tail tube [uncultured Caudovirales phage]